MNKTTSAIVSAAVTGLFLGSTISLSSCHSSQPSDSSQAVMDKHACAKLNSCTGKGGCSTG
ncbi:MAG TPA: hypothetical protein VK348_02300, partial [Planctomycetota bacterium]|nr:hypothetical protein [Planctomycetota bacterium]